MAIQIFNTPEVQDFLRLASGLNQSGGNPRAKQIVGDAAKVVGDAREVIANPDIDIVIELIGGYGIAKQLVLEAIAAHHLGAEVFGVSLVTNLAAGLASEIDHAEVLAPPALREDVVAWLRALAVPG